MHPLLRAEANRILKDLLSQCSESNHTMFKRMYANGKMDLDIGDVVERMDEKSIDNAISQCVRTIDKNKNK